VAAGDAFGPDQRIRLHEAIEAAERQTGLHFPVFVGDVGTDPEVFAAAELNRLGYLGAEIALIIVDPAARVVRVSTTSAARERLTDQACGLAVLSMTTSFGLGDIVGGLSVGLRMLADATAPARIDHGRPLSVSSTITTGV
jgi:hypothetical protein